MKTNTFTELNGAGMRIAVVAARFNAVLTDALLEGCLAGLASAGVAADQIVADRVPGSFELPIAAEVLAAQKRFDAIICLGVLIKGETKHDEYIADAAAQGLTNVSIKHGVPVMFGVLTTENVAQAEARSFGEKNKGWEVAMSAVETVLCVRRLQSS